jgi:DnaK suppressor protein
VSKKTLNDQSKPAATAKEKRAPTAKLQQEPQAKSRPKPAAKLQAEPLAAPRKVVSKPAETKNKASPQLPQPASKSVPTKSPSQNVSAPLDNDKAPVPTKQAKVPQPRLSAAARASAAASTPAPVPAPTSRFADRFAPPRPPTRQMNSLHEDITKTAQKTDPKLANAWKTKLGRELTDDEVLAMPEEVYMNDKQLEFFKLKLQLLKDGLLSNAGETTEHLREDTSIVPDPADRATIEEEHALELRTRDRERKLLKKIAQSLVRIDAGEYGFCDETGEPIGIGRLIARPTATLSLEAQQRRELKQKMFGD